MQVSELGPYTRNYVLCSCSSGDGQRSGLSPCGGRRGCEPVTEGMPGQRHRFLAFKGRHPQTKWAQRSDKVFLTIELSDAKDVKLNLQPDGHFSFSATGPDNVPYAIDFELFDKVNVEESKAAVGLRNICYLVKKAEKKWWSRLLKQEGKPPVYLKVDWDKWVDEDDENESKFGGMDFGDMDFSNLGMGGGDDDFDAGGDDDEEDEEMADTKVGDEDKTGEAEIAPDSNGSEAKA